MNQLEYYEKLAIQAKTDCQFELHVEYAKKVYKLSDKHPAAGKNLAYAYNLNNQPELALEINNTLNQTVFDTLFQRAQILYTLNKKSESYQILDQIETTFELTEDQKYFLWSAKAQPFLQEGNIKEGVNRYLNVDKPKVTDLSLNGIPKWNGLAQPGYTVYVNANGGYGDEFINIRFFHHIKNLGMKPILYSSLKRVDIDEIFCYNGYETVNNIDNVMVSPYTLWCDLMSLPVLLNVTEKTLWDKPYLKPIPNQYQLNTTSKLRIGVKSQGNPLFASNQHRPITLENMIQSVPDIYEIHVLDLDLDHPNAINTGNSVKNWKQTLDILSQLDIVLTSCTSIAHAAGAMGIPTIVCVPINEYYVWTSTRTDYSTPWYDYSNYVVLKQNTPRCWKQPLETANDLLTKWIYYGQNLSSNLRVA